jgi:hypothetical protein
VIFEPTTNQPAAQFPHEQSNAAGSGSSQEEGTGGLQTASGMPREGNAGSRFDAIEERLAGQEDLLYDIPNFEVRSRWYRPIFLLIPLMGMIAFLIFGKVRWQGKPITVQGYFIEILEKRNVTSPDWLVNWNERRMMSNAQLGQRRIANYLRILGYSRIQHLTPKEQGYLLIENIPDMREEISQIIDLFQKEIFAGSAPLDETPRTVFRNLQKAVIKKWIEQKVTAVFRPNEQV